MRMVLLALILSTTLTLGACDFSSSQSNSGSALSGLYVKDDRYDLLQYIIPDVSIRNIRECTSYSELSLKNEDEVPQEIRKKYDLYPLFKLWAQIEERFLKYKEKEVNLLSSSGLKMVLEDDLPNLFAVNGSPADKAKKCGNFGGKINSDMGITSPKSGLFDKLIANFPPTKPSEKISCTAIYFALKEKSFKNRTPFRIWMRSLSDDIDKGLIAGESMSKNDRFWASISSGDLSNISSVSGYEQKLDFCRTTAQAALAASISGLKLGRDK